MSAEINPVLDALEPLAEVPGWSSSFIVTSSGDILAEKGQAAFENGFTSSLASRISRLYESFASTGEQATLALLRFDDRIILLRPLLDCHLVVSATPTANIPMLKTGMAMAIKRITLYAEQSAAEGAAPTPAAASEPQEADQYQMVYRGLRIR